MSEETVDYLTKISEGMLVHAENYHGFLVSVFRTADGQLVSTDGGTFNDFNNDEFGWRDYETKNVE